MERNGDKFAADPIIDISATVDSILLNVRLFVANVWFDVFIKKEKPNTFPHLPRVFFFLIIIQIVQIVLRFLLDLYLIPIELLNSECNIENVCVTLCSSVILKLLYPLTRFLVIKGKIEMEIYGTRWRRDDSRSFFSNVYEKVDRILFLRCLCMNCIYN